MNIVTGHLGFIGSYIYEKLSNAIGFDILGCHKLLETLEKYADSIECVYHMGAISNTDAEYELVSKFNTEYTIELFKKCIELQIPIKYASSASVYGNSGRQYNINPLNYYALSKATIDYWAQDNIDRFKHIQGFRFYNVYGNGEAHKGDQSSPVTKFKTQSIKTGKIKIFEGSSEFRRDFICVEDVCNIVMTNDKPSGIYDLGTSAPVSFKDVAEKIQRKYGGEIIEIPFPQHLKSKYQYSTVANVEFDYQFKTIDEWLDILFLSQ